MSRRHCSPSSRRDLVAVHGQTDQQRLLAAGPSSARRLDAFGGASTLELRWRRTTTTFDAADRRSRAQLDERRRRAAASAPRRPTCCASASARSTRSTRKPGEDDELAAEESRLAHVDGLRRAADERPAGAERRRGRTRRPRRACRLVAERPQGARGRARPRSAPRRAGRPARRPRRTRWPTWPPTSRRYAADARRRPRAAGRRPGATRGPGGAAPASTATRVDEVLAWRARPPSGCSSSTTTTRGVERAARAGVGALRDELRHERAPL